MSITINLPPALEKEAQIYMQLEGKTLEEMFLIYLQREFQRRREAEEAVAELDALLEKSKGRLKGEPYQFNRADAYEPETPCA